MAPVLKITPEIHRERLLLSECVQVVQRHGYRVMNTYTEKDGPASARAMVARLRSLREAMKPVVSPHTFVMRYAAGNVQLFNKYVGQRRFTYMTTCGDGCGAKWNKAGNDITFRIGYMWRRNVWRRFIKTTGMQTDKIFILSATEYRINIEHIRLYAVKVFDLKEKKEVNGFIGQSKLGGKSVFKKERNLAIAGAIKLARNDVSNKILGETE